MRKTLFILGLFLASALIACSDDEGGPGVDNGVGVYCPAGYQYTTNQQVINMYQQYYGYYNNNNYNQYPYNNNYNQYPTGNTSRNCIEQNAYYEIAQQLGLNNGNSGGGNSQQYCQQNYNSFWQPWMRSEQEAVSACLEFCASSPQSCQPYQPYYPYYP